MKWTKHILAFLTVVLGAIFQLLYGQPLVTISDIQTPISTTNDTSQLYGQYVRVRGVVVTPPDSYYAAPNRYAVWIQDSGNSGPKTGLQVYLHYGNKAAATGLSALQPGYYAEFKGTIGYYRGETQLELDTNATITVLNVGIPVQGPDTIQAYLLNNNMNQAQPTGEEWQGSYVALKDLDVVYVSTSATRGYFDVKDANGNLITIWDNFKALDPTTGFIKPQVGDHYNSIAGIVFHYKFGTTDKYELLPFKRNDLILGFASPSIQSLSRDIACPKSTDSVQFTVTVIHPDTSASVVSVEIKYGISPTDTNYQTLSLVETSPGTWQGKLAPQPHGTFIHYHAIATDNNGRTGRYPYYAPYCFTVNDSGCRISDIQRVAEVTFQPTEYYTSGYEGMTVTNVPGIVTASTFDLGYVYIQEEGKTSWAGIQLIGDPSINNFKIGDKVSVTGIVREYFGLTQIEVTSSSVLSQNNPVPQTILPVTMFGAPDDQTYQTEAYESMLITFADSGLRVVNVHPETVYNSGLGDYRVGVDPLDPNRGILVIAGRQTSNIFSSLNVSYINDSSWITLDGPLAVTPCIVTDSTTMDSLTGILTFQWSRVKLMPRYNRDFVNVQNTTCGTASLLPFASSHQIEIHLYPNPIRANYFYLYGASVKEIASLELVSLDGKTQKLIFNQSGEKQLKVELPSNLPSGFYVLYVYDRSGFPMGTIKLIK